MRSKVFQPKRAGVSNSHHITSVQDYPLVAILQVSIGKAYELILGSITTLKLLDSHCSICLYRVDHWKLTVLMLATLLSVRINIYADCQLIIVKF